MDVDFAVHQIKDGVWVAYALDPEQFCPRIATVAAIAVPAAGFASSAAAAAEKGRFQLGFDPS
jgi:hypothetical protein